MREVAAMTNICTGLDEPDLARLRGIVISQERERALLESWAAARGERAALAAAPVSEPAYVKAILDSIPIHGAINDGVPRTEREEGWNDAVDWIVDAFENATPPAAVPANSDMTDYWRQRALRAEERMVAQLAAMSAHQTGDSNE